MHLDLLAISPTRFRTDLSTRRRPNALHVTVNAEKVRARKIGDSLTTCCLPMFEQDLQSCQWWTYEGVDI